MSDSEADIPSQASIARALRDVVIAIHKSGNSDDLTVKRVRTRVEEELGLPAGFLKNQDWKQKSHELIHEAVDEYCGDEPTAAAPKPKATPAKKAPPKKATKPKPEPKKKTKPASDSTRGVKRKAATPAKKPQKRRKTASSDEEEEEEEELSDIAVEDRLSDAESEPPRKAVRRQKKVVADDSDGGNTNQSKEDEADGEHETKSAVQDSKSRQKQTPPPEVNQDASDSDLSSLIDESPVKKRQQKKAPAGRSGKERKPKEPKIAKSKATTKSKAEDNPDQAEIKRLQSWLVKCGIRKVWGKELAKCDTPKEKIKHLKGMLQDAGMDGKYSNEKAAQIKEQREFAKDLEEIQAGALAWGESGKTETGRPRRRANKPIPKPVVPSDEEDVEDQAPGDKDDTDDDIDDDDEDVKEESEESEDDDVESSASE